MLDIRINTNEDTHPIAFIDGYRFVAAEPRRTVAASTVLFRFRFEGAILLLLITRRTGRTEGVLLLLC